MQETDAEAVPGRSGQRAESTLVKLMRTLAMCGRQVPGVQLAAPAGAAGLPGAAANHDIVRSAGPPSEQLTSQDSTAQPEVSAKSIAISATEEVSTECTASEDLTDGIDDDLADLARKALQKRTVRRV